jgi:hypothetical protein
MTPLKFTITFFLTLKLMYLFKNEISKAIEALEKELTKSKMDSNTLLNRCCSQGALDKNDEENNQATSSKTSTKSSVLFTQLQQKLRNYEEEKTYTISSILKQFILIQLTFNSQSQRVFACAYKCLTNTFVEFDISKELYRICKDLYYPNYKYIFRNLSPSWGSSSPSPPPTVTVSQAQTSKKASKTSLPTPQAPSTQPPPPPPAPTLSGGSAPRPLGGQASSTTAPSTSSFSQQTPSQIQLLEQMKKLQPKWQQPKVLLSEPVAKLPPPSPNKQTSRKQVSESPKSSRSETITNTSELHLSGANKNVNNNSSLNNLILSHDFSSSNNSVKLNKVQSYESLNTVNPANQNRFSQPLGANRQVKHEKSLQQPPHHSQLQQQQAQQPSTRQMMSNLKETIKQNIMNMMKRNTNRPSKSDLQKKATIHEYKFRVVDEEETSSSDDEYDSLSLRSLGSAQEQYINSKIDEWIQKNLGEQASTHATAPPAPSSQYSDNTNTLTNATSITRDSRPRLNIRSSTDTLVKEKKRAQSEFHHYENVQSVLVDENANWPLKLQDLSDEDELIKRFNNLRRGTTTTTATSASATTTTTQSYKTNSVLDTLGSESTGALYVATGKQAYGSESNIARSAFRPQSNNLLRIMTHTEQEDFLKGNQNKFNYRNTLSTVSSAGSSNLRSNSARSYAQTHRGSHETRL